MMCIFSGWRSDPEGGSLTTVLHLGGGLRTRADDRLTKRKSLLYEDVIEAIEHLVVERGLKPGDLLPTQAELGQLCGVSLITVRRALEELERSGSVRRHQGLGTFLARPRIVAAPARAGGLLSTISGEARATAIVTDMVELSRGTPSADVALALQVPAGTEVWKVHRRRSVEGRPLIVETAVIPTSLAPGLDQYELDLAGSLYELLSHRYGLVDDYEEQLLEVVAPTVAERELLKLTARVQVVRLRGRSMDPHGVVFDCFEHVYPATDFIFSIFGPTSRQLVRGPDERDWSVSPLPS